MKPGQSYLQTLDTDLSGYCRQDAGCFDLCMAGRGTQRTIVRPFQGKRFRLAFVLDNVVRAELPGKRANRREADG